MKYFAIGIIALIGLTVISFTCNMCGDTVKTVQKEFKPSTLLKKYEYFKDLSAGIDRKRADIEVIEDELQTYVEPLDKDRRFYYELRKSEALGLISIHNKLCSEYNSAMSKFNYRFTNKGDLPDSNLDPLPREYREYKLKLNKQKTTEK